MNSGMPENNNRPREAGTDVYNKELTGSEIPHDPADKDILFYKLFARLVSAMTATDGIDVELIENILIEISLLLRICKAVTRVYKNMQEEEKGEGETLCCYDNGKEGKEIMSLRVVTSVMTSATSTVYMSPDS